MDHMNMTSHDTIVMTGIGLVSPLGTAKEAFFKYVGDGEPRGARPEQPGGPEPGGLLKHLGITDPRLKVARYLDPVSKNAIIAMREALVDAGLTAEAVAADPCGFGILLGTSRGACVTREGLYGSLQSRQGRMVSATLFSHCGYNIAGAMTAIAYGMKGPNVTIAGQGDLGLTLLRRARRFLLSGRAHTLFAGFSECGDPLKKGGRSFDEAACFFCLETKNHAAGRGAVILAEIGDLPDAGPREEAVSTLDGLQALGDRYASLIALGASCRERGASV
jgi:3-oxoacyl-(acyl-carrier-protein) synthase